MPQNGAASTILSTNPIQFSPDGRLLAACHLGDVTVGGFWNPLDGSIERKIYEPSGVGCSAMAFTSDGALFLRFVNRDFKDARYTLTAYSTETWRLVWGLRLDAFQAVSLTISPDGTMAALGGYALVQPRRDEIYIVNLPRHTIGRTIESDSVGPMAWSPDGTRIAVAGDQHVDMFDVRTGQALVRATLTNAAKMNIRYTPDGRYLVESDMNGRDTGLGLRIWDSKREKLLQEVSGDAGAIDVSSDGQYLAVGFIGHTTIYQFVP
jgi:WD40 repeat protein